MGIRISETYSIVTEESAKEGEFSETGFNFENQEFGFRELVEYIRDGGFSEPSCWPATGASHEWLTTPDDDINYQTGEQTQTSIHFADAGNKAKYWCKAFRAAGLTK